MNLPYVVPRVIRHFLPEGLTRFLLLRSLFIKPGLETADPQAAVRRYDQILRMRGDSLKGKRMLVFGYGGRFDVGVGLLEAGAEYVILCDKYAPPDDGHNKGLAKHYSPYVQWDDGKPSPRLDRMMLLSTDIRGLDQVQSPPQSDLVVSTSVYEHVDDVDGSTRALARLTSADGLNIHFIDLRDHFFKYPFEMLTYSSSEWRRWLNPTSNHNRLRLRDYRRVFAKYFEHVEIEILERDATGFERAKNRIRPEFLTGDAGEDSATLIQVLAAAPRRRA
jgi:hypothetical protein